MGRDVILFADKSPERAALAYQRMSDADKNRTIWCKNAKECIEVLDNYRDRLEKVFLDHDFEEGEFTNINSENSGTEVVRFLEKQDVEDYKPCRFIIHTHNLYAGSRMLERLFKWGVEVKYTLFGSTKLS